MVIIKLWGGLGNQLFQYSYGYKIAQKTGDKLYLDISWYKHHNDRQPEILNFNISYDEVGEYWKQNKRIAFLNKKWPNRIIRIINASSFKFGGVNYLKETKAKYVKKYDLFKKNNCYLDGYWQCPRYFESHYLSLKEKFVPKNTSQELPRIIKIVNSVESVAIHLRRGDYLKKKSLFTRLKTISEDYYLKALEYFSSHKRSGKYVFFVFSNDIKEAKKMFEPFSDKWDFRFLSNEFNLSAIDEWLIMKNCKHQIIGNSTFSWWCAYLNEHKDKIVISPNAYMGNLDILPSEWISIDAN